MKETTVTDPAERVQAALDALDLDIRVQTFDAPTSTAEEAAAAIGCELGAIVKSLCFIVGDDPVLVLAAGDRRVDSKALRRIFGVSKRQVAIADRETVLRVTGYEVGGVPPLGHPQPLRTLIDRSLGRFTTVYAAAGTSHAIFPIPYETLITVTAGTVEDLVLDS
jgi:prolyl-tRNA editing enzyme YbaK/EbsC (Cys-tRNA(Pro) deacylase)